MFIFWDQKHNQKTLDKLTVWWGGGGESTLMVSLAENTRFLSTSLSTHPLTQREDFSVKSLEGGSRVVTVGSLHCSLPGSSCEGY